MDFINNNALLLLIAACSTSTLAVLVVAFFAYRIFKKASGFFVGGLINKALSIDQEEKQQQVEMRARELKAQGIPEHRDPDEIIDQLDFDEALLKQRMLEQQDAPPEGEADPVDKFEMQDHDVNASSPVHGRIMRDGRYRRVTGGTPGRVSDQDFRQVGNDVDNTYEPDGDYSPDNQ